MIKLTFNNPNSRTLTNIDIYREPVGTAIPDTPIKPPIVTLDGFETTYIDNDVEIGVDYNYRFRVYRPGGESVMSPNMVFGDVSLYGPGTYYNATSITETIWDLGDASPGDDVPSMMDLVEIAGPNSEYVHWSGKWRKFRIGSDIFITPLGGAVRIIADEFETFMSNAASKRLLTKGYCTYEYIRNMGIDNASSLLDGRYPTKWSLRKEYNRQDVLEPFAGKENPFARLVFAVKDEMNGQAFRQSTSPYGSSISENIYMTAHYNYEWYWKPILRFIPKTERNY